MYNSTPYEEYMRTVLGYIPNSMQDMYTTNDYYIVQNNCINDGNLYDLYPEIYRKIYPLVCNECNSNQMPITQEILETMTDSVYDKIEIDLKIHTNVEIRNDTKQTTRQEDRKSKRDDRLRDLIKILILNELLRGNRFPNRPPFPRPGVRPPFVGNNPIMQREL